MGALSAVLPRGCWPWQLALGLIYYSLMGFRVLETVDTRPVRGHREQMLLYCHEILAQGFSEELEDGRMRQMWQLQMLKEGASRHVLKAMEDFPKDPTLHSTCMHALCAVAFLNAGAQQSLLELGAVSSVLISGLSFVSDPDVTAAATATLSCLVHECSDAKDSLVKMGGLQFAVDSRDRHPDKPNVLYGACTLVASMCFGNPKAKTRTNELDFAQRGLQGIWDFPNSGDKVRQEVMRAFNALSGTPPMPIVQYNLMQAGVLEGVLTVLRENNDDMTTLTNANRVVQNLAMHNNTYRVVMMESGVAELLAGQLGAFNASKAGAFDVDVDLTAVQALSELAREGSEDDNRRRLLKAGVLEKIQDAMKKRPGHTGLADAGRALMNRLKSVEKQS